MKLHVVLLVSVLATSPSPTYQQASETRARKLPANAWDDDSRSFSHSGSSSSSTYTAPAPMPDPTQPTPAPVPPTPADPTPEPTMQSPTTSAAPTPLPSTAQPTTAIPTPSPTLAPGPYVGCFQDSGSDGTVVKPDLTGSSMTHENMTQAMCRGFCEQRGYWYYGISKGTVCACDDYSVGTYGGALGACDVPGPGRPCPGDPTKSCGYPSANVVYRTANGPSTDLDFYIGCFKEGSGSSSQPKDLTLYGTSQTIIFGSTNAPWKCGKYCVDFRYYSLQGDVCRCGNSYGRYGIAGAACPNACTGDATGECGGSDSISVYWNSFASPTPEPTPLPSPRPTPTPGPTLPAGRCDATHPCTVNTQPCCSSAGWCGSTENHCSKQKGCLGGCWPFSTVCAQDGLPCEYANATIHTNFCSNCCNGYHTRELGEKYCGATCWSDGTRCTADTCQMCCHGFYTYLYDGSKCGPKPPCKPDGTQCTPTSCADTCCNGWSSQWPSDSSGFMSKCGYPPKANAIVASGSPGTCEIKNGTASGWGNNPPHDFEPGHTWGTCQRKCINDPQCRSFQYRGYRQECQLHTDNPTQYVANDTNTYGICQPLTMQDLSAMSCQGQKNTPGYESSIPPLTASGGVYIVNDNRGGYLSTRLVNPLLKSSGSTWEMWNIEDIGDGYYTIRDSYNCEHGGRFLSAQPSGLVEFRMWLSDWEKWRIRQVVASGNVKQDGVVTIQGWHGRYLTAGSGGFVSNDAGIGEPPTRWVLTFDNSAKTGPDGEAALAGTIFAVFGIALGITFAGLGFAASMAATAAAAAGTTYTGTSAATYGIIAATATAAFGGTGAGIAGYQTSLSATYTKTTYAANLFPLP